MIYCLQPDWPSDFTYKAIRQRLLDENPGFKTSHFGWTALISGVSLSAKSRADVDHAAAITAMRQVKPEQSPP